MMKNNKIKVGQKLTNPSKDDLYVHPYARAALCVWQRLRPKTTYINTKFLDNFYRPPLRLVDGGDGAFYFFNDFQRVDQVLRFESDSDYPCLIIPESIKNVQQLAWMEVINLMFLKGIHHPDLFKALKSTAPQSVICQLMGVRQLTVKEYCHFAGISQSSYEYRQCKFALEDRVLGMPQSMSWLSGAP
ncbi:MULTISPECIES: hypothetical protein [unclassified Psychrobacter]|uniref:hypothetical protein n=1 Tax=unclassified Psychrobacter TaxID=196806 RepID=UPI0018F46F4E|nr:MULTISPECIES: hypothetical protein [unclassified Psychrobacter]